MYQAARRSSVRTAFGEIDSGGETVANSVDTISSLRVSRSLNAAI
jgi:hypothetical protein